MKVWREANQKPPLGAVVNWASDANRDLVSCYLVNETGGSICNDSVNNRAWHLSGHVWRPSGVVKIAITQWAYTTPITIIGNYTVIVQTIDTQGSMWWLRDAADVAKCGPRTTTSFGFRPYTGAGYVSIPSVLPTTATYRAAAQYNNNITRLWVDGVGPISVGSGYTAGQTNTWTVGFYADSGATTGSGLAAHMLYARALTSEEIAWDYAEPYGRERYLVPGFARIFDMGGGGPVIPIGAIRSRFPVLTGGLRT